MNAIAKSSAAHTAQWLASDLALREARQHTLQRTVQALFRENLLRKAHLMQEGAIAWLPLWSQQGLLRFEGLQIGRIGNCRLAGPVSYHKPGETPQPIATAAALLACVAPSLALPAHPAKPGSGQTSLAALNRLILELDNSTENEALCLNWRQAWAQQLRAQFGPGFIACVRHADLANPALLLEQWGSLGHPSHPTSKSKTGLTSDEVMAFSPEFQPTLHLPLAALRAEQAHLAFADARSGDGGGAAYQNWFAQTYPEAWRNWQAALQRLQLEPRLWLPLPLHPYQAQRVIGQKFAAEIAAGTLLLLDDVSMAASPTMSFRTVVPDGSAALPHIKLPVSLRLTTAERTVSPKSTVMGPRLTQLISGIIAHERGFGGTLDILGEEVGLHYLDPDQDDERARHLSVLFRANPMSKCGPDRFAVPVGALAADSPEDGRALVAGMVALACGDHAEGAVAFFAQYAATVLSATVSAWLLYGISFEAHQQNSFIMLNLQYEPVQLLVRDFGDLAVHGPTLRATGLNLEPYRPGHTVFESEAPVRNRFLHSVMLCHLAELALLLAHTYQHPEDGFWRILRRETENVFERLRSRTEASRWQRERQAVMEADWPVKALLHMRLMDEIGNHDTVQCSIPNPLRLVVA
jgi:siderophore synthetase component